jgi:nicotinate-nucleotide adenylyltransferase
VVPTGRHEQLLENLSSNPVDRFVFLGIERVYTAQPLWYTVNQEKTEERRLKPLRRVGVMGGTFDPIHVGHLVTAEEVRVKFGLDEVVFVPCGIPPHKKGYEVTPAEHRYLMVVLATASNPHFIASRVEIDRAGPSYAIDTLRFFKQHYGEGTHLYFITGADAILEIMTWRDSEELFHLCRFVAATRPGYHLDELEKRLTAEQMAHVDVVTVPGIEISSTDVRQRVEAGLPIRYLVPASVEGYIYKCGFYQK